MAELSALRVPASELAQYRSVAHIGNKKQQEKSVSLAKRPDAAVKRVEELNSVKGAKRRKIEVEEKPESSESEISDSDDENISDEKNEAKKDEIPEKIEAKKDVISEKIEAKKDEIPERTIAKESTNIMNEISHKEPDNDEIKEERIKMPPQNLAFVPVERPKEIQARL